ncbi:hypothetical protein PILCRDRAFT_830480 [Piloderma croceum F 1598]|uniref:Nephrocystin 3-like N-terminal domain-containing protein n=1 Tax=Piloderma croceum (strain F 1598) TaxID=765440 RepID=A0A0C3B1X5_PILCF|nr:hypothetical protein PILCRDRAFT_830480 [Piloderma croceum F 1598]
MASSSQINFDARGGTFNDVRGHQFNLNQFNQILHNPDLSKLLDPLDAAYNRNGPIAKCLQGTRERLIATIVGWIDGDMDRPICWLNGPAGSGKSAVSQTVAELCDASRRLAASFFFFRGAGDRSRITRLIPTLAYQLSISIPATKPFIQDMLRTDPLIVRQALRYQFQKLVIEPILAVTDTNTTTTPMIIFVDALDECDDRELMAEFIEIVADAYRGNHRLPLRVFFTSRVEEHLRKKLEAPTARSVIYHLALQDFDAADDIRKFFRHRFATIYEENHRLMRAVPWPWPSHTDLEALVEKASGSFIFAFTLINFVDDGADLPHQKLPIALAAHAGLDPLYTEVLSTAPRGEVLKRVIGTILLLKSDLSITSLGHLLQLNTAHLLQTLLGVQSILMIPGNDDEPVRLFHTSLRDFLMSKPRSGGFFIDPPARHLDILLDCLNSCYLTNFASESFDYWVNTLLIKRSLGNMLNMLHQILLRLKQLPSRSQGLLQTMEDIEERAKVSSG